MAKCIQTTNEIPTAWAAFRDGAQKLPMCPSAQNDSTFHSEIVTTHLSTLPPFAKQGEYGVLGFVIV